jgi:hypothetical protein
LQLQGSVLLNVRYARPHSDQGSKIWSRASSTHTYRSHIYNANIRNTVSVSTNFADAANKTIFRSTIPRNVVSAVARARYKSYQNSIREF